MFSLLKLALRNVLRHKGRTALTLVSIVFGVAAVILSGGFIEDTIVKVGESMIHSHSGHIQVSRQGYSTFGSQNPEKYLIDRPEQLRQTLAGTPGVDDVLLRIGFSGLLGNGRSDWPIVGEGVEPEREARLGSYVTLAAGRQFRAGDKYVAMIGHGVARALKLKPGDPVTLLVSTAGGAANLLDLEVVGIFQTYSKDYDARALRIPLVAAQELLATEGAHVAVISLKQTADTDRTAAALRAVLAADGLELNTWVELNEFYAQTVALYQQQFGFLMVIVLIMLQLGVSNTINLGVFERVGEFGTMRAMGDRAKRLRALVICEGAVLGFIGGAVGVVVGATLAVAISAVGIPMPPPPNADLGYTSHILVVPGTIALAFLIGLAAAVLASILPAVRVSRMEIAEALRQGV
uniref:LolE permease component of an ABC-transporter system n=1 Tax=uncultured bacterium CSL11 TaxID=1091566 RepID=G4WVE0_9BACT|nr:LolE permease component of an ABC-transporter system [uncultured bacterium CSL11]